MLTNTSQLLFFYGMKFQKANFLLPMRQLGSFSHIAMRGMAAS